MADWTGMSRRVAQLHFADGRMVVTVVPDADADVVRFGDRRFEKVAGDDEILSYREVVGKAATPDHSSDALVYGCRCGPSTRASGELS